VGKSTLFNAITDAHAECANYPFCTIEPNVGVVAVPDARLSALAALYAAKKVTPTVIEFVDIAGLVRGASKGEGLGNKFLSHIREVDAIVHVVRCFDDANIAHTEAGTDPLRDVGIIDLELMLSDLDSVRKRLDRVSKTAKTDKKDGAEAAVLTKLAAALDAGIPARKVQLTPEEREIARGSFLLSDKPVLYAANIAESDIGNADNEYVAALKDLARGENAEVLVISAKIEAELAALPPDERELFLSELGLNESGLSRLIKQSYDLLGLMSFLTAGEKEVRAWTIEKGTKAPQAAGKIHTDFERGFIRAEIVSYDDLIALRSTAAVKEKGLMRSEGKDYVMRDGDVVLFKFNI
jgi:GTP-binding protein YchF